MNDQWPIGLFDSGVGGLTVLEHVNNLMPKEDLIYVADSGNAPYGDKSEAFIRKRSVQLCTFLIEQNVKAIVIACNTATAAAAEFCRMQFDLPIIAMEPGVKPALEVSKNGRVGVLATTETAHSAQLENLIKTFADGHRVLVQDCPGLVEQIESHQFDHDETHHLLKQYLAPLMALAVDTIVLGCSHYPIVKDQIQKIVGQDVQLIETGEPVAKELWRRLQVSDLHATSDTQGTLDIFSTDIHTETAKLLAGLTDMPFTLRKLLT